MKNVANTIEDLLEILAGMKQAPKMQIESNDATIMLSIARQVFKGTALTDRQFTLMQEKLQSYRDQFTALEYDFDNAVKNLRLPLRYIDRSKYIRIVSHSEMLGSDKVYESYKESWRWIEVRFPFSKKLIMKINEINQNKEYYHEKGAHNHFFKLNERNTVKVIETFNENEFDVQSELIEFYNQIKEIENQKDSFVPSILNYELVNVDPRAVQLANKELGVLDKNSLIKYIDRRKRYGIVEFDESSLTGDLAEHVALRKDKEMLFKPNEYRIDEVLGALEKLNRYPILIVLDEKNADSQLHMVYNFYKTFVPAEEQSVLFRLDGAFDSEFNQLVKDYHLNNWVDKNTKVVYINTNKLPKVLFNSDWKPITAFTFDSRLNRNVDTYITDTCDLIAFYDDELSPLRRYSRYYG
jgi:hypothetical protein